jgi:hypothetical protein
LATIGKATPDLDTVILGDLQAFLLRNLPALLSRLIPTLQHSYELTILSFNALGRNIGIEYEYKQEKEEKIWEGG